MEIHESRINNRYSISSVEKWLELTPNVLAQHYDELINDSEFLSQVSDSIAANMNYKSDIPGLFKKIPIKNVDWYGLQRILLYCLVRELSYHAKSLKLPPTSNEYCVGLMDFTRILKFRSFTHCETYEYIPECLK